MTGPFVSSSARFEVTTPAPADGSTRTLTEAVDGIAGVTVSPNGARVAYGDEQIHVVEVESGEATIQETARRICKRAGYNLADLDGFSI